MFTIVVSETNTPQTGTELAIAEKNPSVVTSVERYRQTVEVLDIRSVINAVNPTVRRQRKARGKENST